MGYSPPPPESKYKHSKGRIAYFFILCVVSTIITRLQNHSRTNKLQTVVQDVPLNCNVPLLSYSIPQIIVSTNAFPPCPSLPHTCRFLSGNMGGILRKAK